MTPAPALNDEQRSMLAEFDALVDQYLACDVASSIEHPLHDALGALAVVVAKPSHDSALTRRHADAIAREDHRLPVWLNPDGTFNT